jgi:hypothetical protein
MLFLFKAQNFFIYEQMYCPGVIASLERLKRLLHRVIPEVPSGNVCSLQSLFAFCLQNLNTALLYT